MKKDLILPTEAWMRNPTLYIREAAAVGHPNLLFMQAHVYKYNLNPAEMVRLNYGGKPWRILVVENSLTLKEVREYDSEHDGLVAKWPIWEYGQPMPTLYKMAKWAEENQARVLIDRIPNLQGALSRQFVASLGDIQAVNPNAIIHLHGLYSYRWAFGSGVGAADFDPKARAQSGGLLLPNGARPERWEEAQDYKYWIQLLGYKFEDMADAKTRCKFNIEAAVWAGENFRRNIAWGIKRTYNRDEQGNVIQIAQNRRNAKFGWVKEPKEGDYFSCDACQFATNCKFYRARSLCSVTGSKGDELAKQFKSRNADSIIDGLGSLLETQTERLEKALDKEEELDALNSNVTKLIESIFDRGTQLAKLLEPQRFSATSPANKPLLPPDATPQALAAAVIHKLELEGMAREDITPQMVMRALQVPEDKQEEEIRAIIQGQ